ncbi:MAG: Eco57I restriction-modification methylase domain-containing protein [Propionibacteriaceae bacterium]|nr:Eco57I restriction-modification methylase domain-containing protein [Propionibacteriaceae bacterium]
MDINPVTLGLQAVASHGKLTGKASLELADYRSWLSAANLGETTLFLGNPPYTRWQLLNKTDRLQLVISADGLAGSRANLSTLFLAITLAKLRKKDSLAMIVPAGWMRAEYGKGLREWLRQAHRRPIMLRRTDSWQFPQAIVETVVLEVGPEQTYRQPIRLFNWAQTESQELSRDGGAAPLTSARHPKMGQCASVALGLRLGDVLRVTRGIATGSIHTFVQPPNQWDDLGVPVHFRRTVVRRLRRGLSTCEPLLEIAELLVLESYVRGSERGLEDWLAAAEAAGIDQMFLCRKRSKWYDLSSEVRTPDIILSSLTRDRFHVARNDNQFTITNNLFGGYWEPAVNGNQRDRVLEWLRTDEGQNALMVDAAEEGNGLRRLSPRAVADLILPTRLMETGDNGHLSPRRVKPIGEAS